MHELPLVRRIVEIAESRAREGGARRIISLELRVGELCDVVPLWIERYFRLAAVGTMAEGARLNITSEAASALCALCGGLFTLPGRPLARIACPACGSLDCSLRGGLEWQLERIGVE